MRSAYRDTRLESKRWAVIRIALNTSWPWADTWTSPCRTTSSIITTHSMSIPMRHQTPTACPMKYALFYSAITGFGRSDRQGLQGTQQRRHRETASSEGQERRGVMPDLPGRYRDGKWCDRAALQTCLPRGLHNLLAKRWKHMSYLQGKPGRHTTEGRKNVIAYTKMLD